MIFSSQGVVQSSKRKCIVMVDQQIANYYYGLIPPYIQKQRQKHPAHITIIREFEFNLFKIPDSEAEEKGGDIHGLPLFFLYQGLIHFTYPYFYLKCWSWQIGQIRKEFGLKEFREGFSCYHITVGNVKG